MPKEFWVNVYEGEHGIYYGLIKHCSRQDAVKSVSGYNDCVYRIHIKMKDNYKCQ